MNLEKLNATIETLSEVATLVGGMPEETQRAVEMGLALTIANLFMVELLHNLARGAEPYDAMLSSLRGEMQIPESKATLLHLLTSKPKE